MPDMGLIVCGAIPVLIVAAGMWIYTLFIILRYEKTTGTVVGYKTSRGPRGGGQAEIVEFTGPHGKTVQFTEKVYSTRLIQREGHTVKVLYDPKDPTRARINGFSTLYFFPVILTVVGTLMILSQTPMFSGPIQKLLDVLKSLVDKIPWWL
jgi:hypothetical protein